MKIEGKNQERFGKTQKSPKAMRTQKVGSKKNQISKCPNDNFLNKWRKIFGYKNSTPNSSVSFSYKQTLHLSITKGDLNLPKNSNTKFQVIQMFATKYKLRINFIKIKEDAVKS